MEFGITIFFSALLAALMSKILLSVNINSKKIFFIKEEIRAENTIIGIVLIMPKFPPEAYTSCKTFSSINKVFMNKVKENIKPKKQIFITIEL